MITKEMEERKMRETMKRRILQGTQVRPMRKKKRSKGRQTLGLLT